MVGPDKALLLEKAVRAWRAYQEEMLRQQVHIHATQVAREEPLNMVAYTNARLDSLYREADEATAAVLGPMEKDKIITEEFNLIYEEDGPLDWRNAQLGETLQGFQEKFDKMKEER